MASANLARQLAMNVETWAALQRYGVTERTDVRLDFHYDAPSRAAAEKLVALLRAETDYDVGEPQAFGSFFSRTFAISGTTQSTTVSLDILSRWVTWMDAAGEESGCTFDGWGAQAPAAA